MLTYLKRGWLDTLKGLGGWAALVPVLFIAPVGLALHSLQAPPEAVMAEWQTFLVYGLQATGVVFAIMLLWNVAAAPYRIQKERSQHLQELVEKQERLISGDGRPVVNVHNHITYDGVTGIQTGKRLDAVLKMRNYAIIGDGRGHTTIPALGRSKNSGVRMIFSILLNKDASLVAIKVIRSSNQAILFERDVSGVGDVLVEFTVIDGKGIDDEVYLLDIGAKGSPLGMPKNGVVTCVIRGWSPLTFISIQEVEIWYDIEDKKGIKVGDAVEPSDSWFQLREGIGEEPQPKTRPG